ncbi:MAG TPA: adenylyltransferase/cytidyltransferase family protein, partial [bacterium]|nr:adenylyltransferase/cytidyltransferase family protein [bacterium]
MAVKEKILGVNELAKLLEKLRGEKKRIVHCHGVFDLLHIGHIRYLEQARSMGDVLVVTLTPDKYVDKGPNRPAFAEQLRAEALASLGIVDYVAINEWPTAEETLRLLRPDVYVKGAEFKGITTDMTGKIGKEKAVVDEIGAELAFTEDIVFSSSSLINQYLSNFPDEIQEYLAVFRKRYLLDELLEAIERMSSLKVLVVGDTILDEYQYCDAIGKSSKDPIIALKYQSHDLFAGGVLAVANHVANFAGGVKVATVIGERDSHEDFIRGHLLPNVELHYEVQRGAPTTLKRRFIDAYTFNKLFEVYVMDDAGLDADGDASMCGRLRDMLPEYDVVLVSDFGHGAISAGMIAELARGAKFLAVNTQANAGNRGFNTVAKYPRADYVCIAEHEMRLEKRDLKGSVQAMLGS